MCGFRAIQESPISVDSIYVFASMVWNDFVPKLGVQF